MFFFFLTKVYFSQTRLGTIFLSFLCSIMLSEIGRSVDFDFFSSVVIAFFFVLSFRLWTPAKLKFCMFRVERREHLHHKSPKHLDVFTLYGMGKQSERFHAEECSKTQGLSSSFVSPWKWKSFRFKWSLVWPWFKISLSTINNRLLTVYAKALHHKQSQVGGERIHHFSLSLSLLSPYEK